MTPRDYSIMLGNEYFHKPIASFLRLSHCWQAWRGESWPLDHIKTLKEWLELPENVKEELCRLLERDISSEKEFDFTQKYQTEVEKYTWQKILSQVASNSSAIYNQVPNYIHFFNAAESTRVGRDVYIGSSYYGEDLTEKLKLVSKRYPEYRWHGVDSGGHVDGTFCPVTPGLIVSLKDIPTYADTFPGWEVVYLPGQSWDKVRPFLNLKYKNGGKWWVPGEELNDDFTNFVESWLGHWVGFVEETVFDVNMLVIDQKNVVCNNYNEKVFEAFDRYGITPHIINFRHRYFWDGGLHCITSDVHREGVMKDYFPERG